MKMVMLLGKRFKGNTQRTGGQFFSVSREAEGLEDNSGAEGVSFGNGVT